MTPSYPQPAEDPLLEDDNDDDNELLDDEEEPSKQPQASISTLSAALKCEIPPTEEPLPKRLAFVPLLMLSLVTHS